MSNEQSVACGRVVLTHPVCQVIKLALVDARWTLLVAHCLSHCPVNEIKAHDLSKKLHIATYTLIHLHTNRNPHKELARSYTHISGHTDTH